MRLWMVYKLKIFAADIGGTKVKTCISNEHGHIQETNEFDTESHLGGHHIIQKVMDEIAIHQDIDAVGISTAGQVNSEKGSIIYANKNIPEYTGLPIKNIIEDRFQIPVKVENDVNAAALGELTFGSGQGYDDFLCLTYGTGIGGAVIQNQKLFKGADGVAGEFGHMITNSKHLLTDKPVFYEDVASVTALVKKASEIDEECTNGKVIFEKISQGHTELETLVQEWMSEVSAGLISLVHIFNPSMILIGGGVMEQNVVVNHISKQIQSYVMDSFSQVDIKKASLGNKAGLLGAVSLHL